MADAREKMRHELSWVTRTGAPASWTAVTERSVVTAFARHPHTSTISRVSSW